MTSTHEAHQLVSISPSSMPMFSKADAGAWKGATILMLEGPQPTLHELYKLLPDPDSSYDHRSHHGVLWISEFDYICKQFVPWSADGRSVLVKFRFENRENERELSFHVGSLNNSYKEGLEYLMALGGYKRVTLHAMQGKVDFPVDWGKLRRLIDTNPSIDIALTSMVIRSIYAQPLAKAKGLCLRSCELENGGAELVDSILYQNNSMFLDVDESLGNVQMRRLLQNLACMNHGTTSVRKLEITGQTIDSVVAERLGRIPVDCLALNVGVDFSWGSLGKSKFNKNGPKRISVLAHSVNQTFLVPTLCANIVRFTKRHPSLYRLFLGSVVTRDGVEPLVDAIRNNACLQAVRFNFSNDEDMLAMLEAVSSHVKIDKAYIHRFGASLDKERLEELMSQAEAILEESSMLLSLYIRFGGETDHHPESIRKLLLRNRLRQMKLVMHHKERVAPFLFAMTWRHHSTVCRHQSQTIRYSFLRQHGRELWTSPEHAMSSNKRPRTSL